MLSVGQRQLIAFMRAYLVQPTVLVLDEATSSIDSESEQLIQRATAAITRNRTSLIVAHRLSTIRHADRIMVLDQGQLSQSGSHDELMGEEGMYKELVLSQVEAE
jgi:subfamily B ATP-binding cassette protein MsbA